VLRYPAIATEEEVHKTKLGQHVRKVGEAEQGHLEPRPNGRAHR
jgi:hypothetical protein